MHRSLIALTVSVCLVLMVSHALAEDAILAYIEAPIQEFDVIEATGFSRKVQDRSLACDLAAERAKASLRRAIEAARHLRQAQAEQILNHGTFKYRTRWEPERTTCTVRLELALPTEPITSRPLGGSTRQASLR